MYGTWVKTLSGSRAGRDCLGYVGGIIGGRNMMSLFRMCFETFGRETSQSICRRQRVGEQSDMEIANAASPVGDNLLASDATQNFGHAASTVGDNLLASDATQNFGHAASLVGDNLLASDATQNFGYAASRTSSLLQRCPLNPR
jgi:hypothetical protein